MDSAIWPRKSAVSVSLIWFRMTEAIPSLPPACCARRYRTSSAVTVSSPHRMTGVFSPAGAACPTKRAAHSEKRKKNVLKRTMPIPFRSGFLQRRSGISGRIVPFRSLSRRMLPRKKSYFSEAMENVRPSAPVSTDTVTPGNAVPSRSMSAIRSSTSRCMVRRNGRAPNFGLKPS